MLGNELSSGGVDVVVILLFYGSAESAERLSLENWVRALAISPEARLKLRQKGRQDCKDLVVKGRRIEQSRPRVK